MQSTAYGAAPPGQPRNHSFHRLTVWDSVGPVRMDSALKAGNGEKYGNRMENRPELDRGKHGQKMAWRWIFEGIFHFSISRPFFGHFRPCQARGGFPFGFLFFPHFGFPSTQARQNPNSQWCGQPMPSRAHHTYPRQQTITIEKKQTKRRCERATQSSRVRLKEEVSVASPVLFVLAAP